MPRALLIYPEFPPSYWSQTYALEFIDRKAALPPLGLLTIAGIFSADYELKLIDVHVEPLTAAQVAWADQVFVSAMNVTAALNFRPELERTPPPSPDISASSPPYTTALSATTLRAAAHCSPIGGCARTPDARCATASPWCAHGTNASAATSARASGKPSTCSSKGSSNSFRNWE